MKTFFLTILIAAWPAFAQTVEDAKDRAAYSQAELDQMLAPVALYPDDLLSQLLMAATYPLEIVQAARWSREHPDLQGEGAVRAVAQMDWDPSVKSLVAFPRLLQQMNEKLDWTERLGNAFLGQEFELMRAVQQLRWRAYAAGNLRSSNELTVRLEGTDFTLGSPAPEVVHVPYYDSRVAYGEWESPQYEPVYWSPSPGWAVGIPVSAGFFFGTCDWAGRHVRFAQYRPFYFRNVHRWQRGGLWRHDPDHRRGVVYRNVNGRHPLVRDPLVRDGRRAETNELLRAPQPGSAIPRAEVRTGGIGRPLSVMPIQRVPEEPRSNPLERPVPLPPPLQAVPQSHPLSRPVHAAPQAVPQAAPQPSEPSPSALARPSIAPQPSAPASALARPQAPSPPPQVQPSEGNEGGGLRRR